MMRLELLRDSFYAVSSLWSALAAPSVCGPALTAARYSETAAPVPSAVTAFVDVNVIPMDRERVLTGQTVVVEHGRLVALGPAATTPVPAGALRIDGRGKYLIPGLADMHGHIPGSDTERHLFSHLAHGVTTIRQIGGVGPQNKKLIPLEAAGTTPRLYLPAPILGNAKISPDSVAANVAAYKAAGYDYIWTSAEELATRRTNPVLDSLLTAAARLGLPIGTHDHEKNFATMLTLGAVGGSSEHLYSFQDLLSQPNAAVHDSTIRARAMAVQRAGAWLDVTLVCTEYNQYPTINIATARRIVKALADADAGILVGSDANGGMGSSGSIVHMELASLVRAGLTPYQALRSGSYNVARYLGRLDSSGTVAVGKWADLVLVTGNPLADISRAMEPVGVMIRGRWFDRAELDQGLLGSTRFWVQTEIRYGLIPRLAVDQVKRSNYAPQGGAPLTAEQAEQGAKVKAHLVTLTALADSLEGAKAQGTNGKQTYERVLRQLTDELSRMREQLTPEQRRSFDPRARLWMRESHRQGYTLTVAGVAPDP